MRRLSLFVLTSLWFGSTATAGVDLGGNLPSELRQSVRNGALSGRLSGQIRAVRWVAKSGRTVTVRAEGWLSDALPLSMPAGSWTDVEILFQGAPHLDGRALPMSSLAIALEEPVDTDGEGVTLRLDLSALGTINVEASSGAELVLAVSDCAGARVTPTED